MNVAGHDADFALAWRNNPRAVWPDHACPTEFQTRLHNQHVQSWNTFGNTDDEFDARVKGFEDGVLAEASRNIDDASGSTGFCHGIGHGIKNR